MERVLVLGAGFGGLNVALKLAQQDFDVEIVDRKDYHEYVPGIINIFRDRVAEDGLKLDLESFLSGTGIEFINGEVESIDPENDEVELEDDEIDYDYLVVAVGGEPRTFGVDVSEAYTPYSLEEVSELDKDLGKDDSVAVVGAGYVGVEIAAELAEDYPVTVVDQATRPMARSPVKASHRVLDYFEDRGIDFRGGKRVTDVSEEGIETDSGETVEADRVVWSAGVKPVDLVAESFGENGVEVNAGLSSERFENVYALGDCASSGALKTAHNAMEQAETVADNLDRTALEDYREGTNPLVVSLGKTGMFLYGGKVFKNRLLRRFKDLIRRRYWWVLRKERLKTRLT